MVLGKFIAKYKWIQKYFKNKKNFVIKFFIRTINSLFT